VSIFDGLVRTARRRSPWLFHLNSGGCNGCDIEYVACLTPRYDVEQLGILQHGSPRHADVLVVTGPITRTTAEAAQTVYAQVPDPKVVVAIGTCPSSGNVFAGSPVVLGAAEHVIPVDVYVPGCPPRPDAIIAGIAEAVAILAGETPRRAEKPDQLPASPKPDASEHGPTPDLDASEPEALP
jgi:membrane-bound hydrogenase subunit mbhJ